MNEYRGKHSPSVPWAVSTTASSHYRSRHLMKNRRKRFLGAAALILLLLGIIIWEIRHIRAAIDDCVSDKMCKAMMTDHDDRIEKLEQHVLLGK